MHFIHVVARRFSLTPVLRHSPPDLILHDQHPDLFQLFSEILDVIADEAVVDVNVRPVVEDIERTAHIDFQRRRDILCLRLRLL